MTRLVQVGDQSGTTDYVLARAADHLERGRQLRTTILTAVFYPALVFIAAIGVTIYMLVGIIPKMERILKMRGRSLPAMTQALLDAGAFVRNYWFGICAALAIACITFVLFYRRERSRLIIDRFLARLPIFGKVIRVSGTAIFARGIGLLLESGINLTDVLQTCANLMVNRHQRQRVTLARNAVIQGGTMVENLADSSYFTPMPSKMVAVAEATGRLDTVLVEVARFHEEQLGSLVRRLSMLIEPAIIVIVGSIVGYVYIAFSVAMMAITGGGR